MARTTCSRGTFICVASLAVAISAPESASATGFLIDQQGVTELGRAYAGKAAGADDLSTIFTNAAGLTQLWNGQDAEDLLISADAQVIFPSSQITNTGSTAASAGTLGNFVPYAGSNSKNPTRTKPVPNLYIAKRLADGRAALGFGVNAPFGLATSFTSDWFGRYDAIEASLLTVNLNVVGAYQIAPHLSIGVGANAQYAKVKLINALPNPLTPGGPTVATDGQSAIRGNTWTPGFNVGFLYTPTSATRVGLHYRSRTKHKIDGRAVVTGLAGPLAVGNGSQNVRANLALPSIANIGIRQQFDAFALLVDVEWDDWSSFKEIRLRYADGRPDAVRPSNYRDAYGIAVGAEVPLDTVTLRGGVHYETTPTVDAFRDTTVPDSRRLGLSMGATYRLSEKVSVNLAYNHVFLRAARIALTRTFFDGTQLATAVRINGAVTAAGNTAAVSLRYGF